MTRFSSFNREDFARLRFAGRKPPSENHGSEAIQAFNRNQTHQNPGLPLQGFSFLSCPATMARAEIGIGSSDPFKIGTWMSQSVFQISFKALGHIGMNLFAYQPSFISCIGTGCSL